MHIVRDYFLPEGLKKPSSLVFTCSYSGNTEETITSFHDARKAGCPTIIVTHGGQLKELAEELHVPMISLPETVQPRIGTGYFFASILTALEVLGLISSKRKYIEETKNFLDAQNGHIEEKGKQLAKELKDFVPIIYSGAHLAHVTRIFKINFNETSKVQSFYNTFPELNHNEMVGYTNLLIKPAILLLRSQFDYERIKMRMDVMKGLFEQRGIKMMDISIEGNDWMQENMYTLQLAYYASYYLALEYGMDPAPVEMVEEFKKLLK
jgi:glucose/mannose-6-phosphate isomerase